MGKVYAVLAMVLILFIPLGLWGFFKSDWTGETDRVRIQSDADVAVARYYAQAAQERARADVQIATYNSQAQTAQAQAGAVVFPVVALVVVGGLMGSLCMVLMFTLMAGRSRW